jgi:uncharacterized protein with ParB-like and HNH nuclease domain
MFNYDFNGDCSMIDIADAIRNLAPKAAFRLEGNEYSGLEWRDQNTPKPTEEEVNAEVARLQAEYDFKEYQRLRSIEYPPLTDLADAMYWASQGDNTKLDTYYAACEAVKLKYPKAQQ